MTTPGPHSGEDTFDLIDDAVAALAERRGVWLGDDLATITLVASLIEQAQRWLPQLVHDARANGLGWTDIAHALGTNPDDPSWFNWLSALSFRPPSHAGSLHRQ